ncbi:unnamed protein product [Camellia sinensis]
MMRAVEEDIDGGGRRWRSAVEIDDVLHSIRSAVAAEEEAVVAWRRRRRWWLGGGSCVCVCVKRREERVREECLCL